MKKPKVLLFDIETAPMLGYVWGLWENNVSLDQLKKDWHVLSWSAKWLDDAPSKIMYEDQRRAKNIEDDKQILRGIWKLLDEADIVITQNGKSFDHRKLNARFVFHGFKPPSSYKHIDVKLVAQKHFAFTSNKLEYMTGHLNKKYKKLKHEKFPGFAMWVECLAGNQAAWREMEKYNKYDVLALEELYYKLIPWDSSINFNLYTDDDSLVCSACGGSHFRNNGHYFTATGKFQRYRCYDCGAEIRDRRNMFSVEKRKSLKVGTAR